MSNTPSARTEWRNYWFLPIAGALGYATSVIHIYSLGAYIAPLQAEFGWSRAQVTSGLAVAAFISSVMCVPVGLLIDRIGPRRVALPSVFLISIFYALLGTASGSQANWIFLWAVVALGTLGVQATVWVSAVSSRFSASRGLALAITLSGGSLASSVFPVLATWLIGAFGWRYAYGAVGALWLFLVFPFLYFCFRGARDGKRGEAAAPAKALSGMSLAEGLRSPALYKLLFAGFLFAFTAIAALVHFVPILTDSGTERMAAAGMASLIGIFSIVGRLGAGVLLDRFPGHYVGVGACFLPMIAALLLLFDGGNAVSQTIAAVFIGLTLGSEVDVVAYLASRHFGLKNFGALYGALVMALGLGTAFGPLAAGAMFDRFGSYANFLWLALALMAVTAVLFASLGHAPKRDEAAAH